MNLKFSQWSLIAGALLSTSPAAAQNYLLAPPPIGSDTNDCISEPCATTQHVVDICSVHCSVQMAPGVYHGKALINYYKLIEFHGPLNSDGSCPSPYLVLLDDNDGSGAGALFLAQDHAILGLTCIGIAGRNSGTVGVRARQFSIADAFSVAYFDFPKGVGLDATESSKINVSASWIYGSGAVWAAATDNSTVTVGGPLVAANNPSFTTALVASLFGSIVNFYPSSVSGQVGGASYQCQAAIIKNGNAIPGEGPMPGLTGCQLF